MRAPAWAQYGGPFGRLYRGPWFCFRSPQYGEGWKWAVGHRMGGFYLIELGPLRIGRHCGQLYKAASK
jgi:hypothetical protein